MSKGILGIVTDRNSWPKSVMFLSIFLSALGIVVGGALNDPEIGNMGGVIGVALSFFILFAGRATAERALVTRISSLDDLVPTPPSADLEDGSEIDLEKRVVRLEDSELQMRASLSSMFDWSASEKRYLTVSSVISTLTSGFGKHVSPYVHDLAKTMCSVFRELQIDCLATLKALL